MGRRSLLKSKGVGWNSAYLKKKKILDIGQDFTGDIGTLPISE
jgi:hypothetical protein